VKKIIVDQKKCIGCGLCEALAPKTFKLKNKGKSEVINQEGDSKADIQNAIDSCPVNAIAYKSN
jgi:ferredoxin